MNTIPAGLPVYREATHELLGYVDIHNASPSVTIRVRKPTPPTVDPMLPVEWSVARLELRLNAAADRVWFIAGDDETIAQIICVDHLIRPAPHLKTIIDIARSPAYRRALRDKFGDEK